MIFWVPDQWELLSPRQMSYHRKVLADTVLLLAGWILRCAFLATPQLLPGAEYRKLKAGPNSDSPSYSLSEPTAGKWWRDISRWFRRNSRHLLLPRHTSPGQVSAHSFTLASFRKGAISSYDCQSRWSGIILLRFS